jgi:hypothetical protein
VIDAQSEDLGLRLHKVLVITSQGGELIRSTGAEVEDVEREQDVLAAFERRQRDRIPIGRSR